jgi:EAL domain-containing protein (putative c-di-GMP-specific phosphodiesterase class I)
MPIDILKIAKEFVDDISKNQRNLDMVRAIENMAASFGLQTLAEGVENNEQFEILIQEKCDLIQGYITSPPVSATEFSDHYL